MAVPLFDTDTPLLALRAEIEERIAEVIARGTFILGPEVEAFEAELAGYLGVRHVVGVANGTDAITIALRALGVRPGDEVVVPAFTFYATAEAVVAAGARPVFCDVDRGTRNVTPETVAAALNPSTAAIVAVDLFGCPAPLPELLDMGVPVVEDAAQAAGSSLHGRRAGSLGSAGSLSFYPSKNLGCFGDGGAVATDSEEVAQMARALRFHGSRDKRTFEYAGYNSRLDELQAAILRVLLPHLEGWCQARRALAAAYAEAGLGRYVGTPAVPEGAEPAWHLYVVEHEDADQIAGELALRGIQARGYYRTPLHRQPAMAPYARGARLPTTDEISARNLALPMSPAFGPEEAREAVEALGEAVATL